MNRRFGTLVISLTIISAVLYPSLGPITVHGTLTGTVCIAQAGATSCPVTPPILTGPTPTTPPPQLRVAVVVSGADALVGFDLTLLTDHTILLPNDTDLTNSIITGSTTLVKCIGGVHVAGASCAAATDTVDTIHLAVSSSSFTSPPTTGLLFTAVYNITGSTVATPIGFQTNCRPPTSVAGICITLSNGTPNPPSNQISQTGRFSNLPYYSLSPSRVTLTVARGGTNSSIISIKSLNGFANNVNVTASILPSGPTSPTVTFNRPTVKIVNGGTNATTLTVSAGTSSAGNYVIMISATSGSLLNTLQITLTGPNFAISANPFSADVDSPGSSTISITSLYRYNGTVSITETHNGTQTITVKVGQPNLNLTMGGQVTSSLTATATAAATYVINVTATSVTPGGTLSHSVTILFQAVAFKLAVNPGTLTVMQGVPMNTSLTVSGPQVSPFFVGNVTVVATTSAQGLTASCLISTVQLNSTHTSTTSDCTLTGAVGGDYTVFIIGVSGKLASATSIHVTVQAPDFGFSTPSNVLTVATGNSLTTTFNVTRLVNFNGTVTLSLTVSSGGPMASLNPTTVILASPMSAAPVLLTIMANSTVTPGTYLLTITGISAATGSHSVTLTIVVITTTSPHDLALYSVTENPTTVQVGQNVTFTIVVVNLGKVQENTTVDALVGAQTVAQQPITILPGKNVTVYLQWDTANFATGSYVVGAKILAVPGETILSNNMMTAQAALTLTAPSTGLFSSPYVLPVLIVIAVGAVAAVLALLRPWRRARTKTA